MESLDRAREGSLSSKAWAKVQALASPPAAPIDPPAPHAELEELFAHLVRDLDDAGYFVPADRTTSTLRTLRTTLTKTGWSHNDIRSEEHTSELQSLMRISYAVFCLKKKKIQIRKITTLS